MSVPVSILVAACLAGTPEGPLESLGMFDVRTIPEASGIVQSRRFPGIFWVHNDSGNPPALFAIRRDGRVVREFRINAPNIDWEDIAIDDHGHIHIGDIGNNAGFLALRVIYRIDEPDPTLPVTGPLPIAAASFFKLPSSNRFDAEGFYLEGREAVVVSKRRDGKEADLFAVPIEPPGKLLRPASPRALGRLRSFVEPATGAALSPDRQLLAVCSYAVTRVYTRGQKQDWELRSEVRYPQAPVEGIAWDGRDLILASEGRGLDRIVEAVWRRAAPRSQRNPAGRSENVPETRHPGRN